MYGCLVVKVGKVWRRRRGKEEESVSVNCDVL
jgi:hypothetical protein